MSDKQRLLDKKPYQGKKTPALLKQGPISKRGCTDFFCFILLAATWAGMVFVGIYGFSDGDPAAIFAPYNKFGHPCGLGEQKGFPYIYFLKHEGEIQGRSTTCVKECPSTTTSTLQCAPDFMKSGEECSKQEVYPTFTFVERVCIPKSTDDLNKLFEYGALNYNLLLRAASDLHSCWWMIICVGIIGILIGFIYLVLMRFCSGVVTWGLLVFYELGLIGFGVICYLESEDNSTIGRIIPNFSDLDPTALKIIAYTCFGVAFISFILICMLKPRIKLAIAVLKAAADFIDDVNSIIFVPPFYFCVALIFYLFWIFSFVYLMGANDIIAEKDGLPFAQISWNKATIWLSLLHFFGLVWTHSFLHALPQFVIASSACIWYFRKANKQKSPILLSICRSILHIGSIAMGSIMIGLVDYIRAFMSILERPLKAIRRRKGCVKFCGACAKSCLACFEAGLKYINRHAYVQIAMTGKGFCRSTQSAFFLIMRNNLRFGALHGLGGIFIFIGQVFIISLSTFVGYLIVRNVTYFQERLFAPLTLTIFFFLISLILGHTFMSIYGVAADSIIHCYAMDDELHEEQGGAKYAPKDLKSLVDRHARRPLLKDEESGHVNANNETT